MSTKCTIGYGPNFHLYEECFDTDHVWLQLDGNAGQLEFNSNDKRIRVAIDITVWRKILESWEKCHWSKHPERDHSKEEIDENWLESLSDLLRPKPADDAKG